MAVTRPLKEGSTTTYQAKVAAGFPDILASEMDADLDTIYAAWNGGVNTANLVNGSVTTPKLASAPNGVATGNLNDLAVTTAKLADGAATWPKLSLQSYARVYRAAALAIANATTTTISFDTVLTNVGGLYAAGSPDRFTVQQTGLYLMGGGCQYVDNAGGNYRVVFLVVNATTQALGTMPLGTFRAPMVSTLMSCNAGDTVILQTAHDAGGPLSIVSTNIAPHLWIARVA